MTGREPTAFNFMDLSGEAKADDKHSAGTSTSLLRRSMIPSVHQDDTQRSMQPPRTPDQRFRNPGNSCFRRPADLPVDLRDYDRSGGLHQGRWTRRYLVAPRLQADNSAPQVTTYPTKERELKDQAHLLGNYLTLASSSHQGAEFDRVKEAQKDAANRQKQLVLLQEASHQQAMIQQRQGMILAMQATHEQAATINASPQRASRSERNEGARISPFREIAQRGAQPSHRRGTTSPELHLAFASPAPVPLGTWMKPTSAPILENHGAAMVDKLIKPTIIPGSLNWTYRRQSPDVQAAISSRAGGNRGNLPGTAQMTIFYASMVNVYDDISFDMAQAVCMMLTGQGNKRPPDNGICCPPGSHGSPAPIVPQPTSSPPSTHMSVPSTNMRAQSSHMSAPSTHMSAPPTPPPPPPQAPTTSEAGPSHSMQELGAVFSSVRKPTVTTTGELPQARKASLARFLETRRGRIRNKEKEYAPFKMEREGGSSSPDKSPSSASIGKLPTRSPSPAPSVCNPRRALPPSFSGALWHHQDGTGPCTSKPGSTTQPPPTPPSSPPRQCFSQENSPGNITSERRFECEDDQDYLNKRARSGDFLINDKSPSTTTDYVMREYHAVLKEFHPPSR